MKKRKMEEDEMKRGTCRKEREREERGRRTLSIYLSILGSISKNVILYIMDRESHN